MYVFLQHITLRKIYNKKIFAVLIQRRKILDDARQAAQQLYGVVEDEAIPQVVKRAAAAITAANNDLKAIEVEIEQESYNKDLMDKLKENITDDEIEIIQFVDRLQIFGKLFVRVFFNKKFEEKIKNIILNNNKYDLYSALLFKHIKTISPNLVLIIAKHTCADCIVFLSFLIISVSWKPFYVETIYLNKQMPHIYVITVFALAYFSYRADLTSGSRRIWSCGDW